MHIEVQEKNMWPYTMVYTTFVGDYSKVWPSMDKVYEILSGAGVMSATGVGIYYDDPAIVSWENLRSDVGSIIDPQDTSKLANIQDIKITTRSAGTKVVVEFPLRNMISYMIGPMKVYPVISKYMIEKGYKSQVPMVELYDMAAKKIYYMADITK